MLRVLNCLTTEHDWRLVGLAVVICLLASAAAVALSNRARATHKWKRVSWLCLGALAAGYGIWGTHFVAMLAYEPGVATGYHVGLTALSLVIAVVVTGGGLAVAVQPWFRGSAAIGGGIVGTGIAAMHFTGMAALEVSGHLIWSAGMVVLSIGFGVLFGMLALVVASWGERWLASLGATLLFTLAIVSMHFTAMGAVEVVPDPSRSITAFSMSSNALVLAVAGVAVGILGMCLVAALSNRNADRRLEEQKLLLDTALQNMWHGLCMFSSEGRIVLFNERYRELMGLPAEFLKGLSLLDLFRHRKATGEFTGDPEEFFGRIMAGVQAGTGDTKLMESATGRVLRVVDRPMKGGGWVATYEDITEWRKAQAQIHHMARHDGLTDLPNRTLFHEQLQEALKRVHRNEQVAVLCLDLDRFKQVNDTLGHPAGDDLLKTVARRLRDAVRETDTLARLGGDEFAVVQTGALQQPTESAALASRLIDILSAPYDINGHHVVIGTSIGLSIAPADGMEPAELMRSADLALYRAKTDGRGTYRFFEPEMDASAQARRALELDLRAALVRGEFEVHYQPVHDVATSEITSVEALVRWNHPTRGLMAPDDFIPLAEQTGLIVPLGEWVLRTACRDAARWPQEVSVAVNLSAVQFMRCNLVALVLSALAASGLAARRLELEITESVLLQDIDSPLAILHELHAIGVRIAMDDFGTGYSSLSYLRSFPFDRIKIDRSFIRELETRDESMAIVRAVTGLGRSLGISTTAEGVETSEQLEVLRSEGCTEVQGYFFHPPRPAPEIDAVLAREDIRYAIGRAAGGGAMPR